MITVPPILVRVGRSARRIPDMYKCSVSHFFKLHKRPNFISPFFQQKSKVLWNFCPLKRKSGLPKYSGRPRKRLFQDELRRLPEQQQQRRRRLHRPWGCCPCRSDPSSQRVRAQKKNQQTEHRHGRGPESRSGRSWQDQRPRYRGAGYGPCRRRKRRRSTSCRSRWPTSCRCRQRGAGSGRVGGVTSDGALDVLLLHDGNTLHDVVGAIALDGCTLAGGEGDLLDDGQSLGGDVILGLHISEAVDAGDDVSSILAEAVQDDAQGGLADLVCGAGDADRTLSGCEGLVAGEESEAGGVLAQQTSAQIAVAQTDLTLLSDRAGDGEGFQTLADGSSALGSIGQAALDGDGGAQSVGPDCVIEADGCTPRTILSQSMPFARSISLQASRDSSRWPSACLDLRHAAIHRFKSCHELFLLSYSSRGSMYLTALICAEAAVSARSSHKPHWGSCRDGCPPSSCPA